MFDKTRTNVIVNIVRTLVLTILSFITFPWVCRFLGSNALGTYTWANTFVSYFLILAKIGIPNLAIRECAKVKDDKELLSNKVQTFFIIQLITTVLSFGLMTALVFSVPELTNSNEIIFLLSLNFLSGAFSFEWLFIALEKQFYMAARTIGILTLSAMLIIIFVSNPSDIYIYSIITISVTLLTSIANLIYLRKYVSLRKTMPYSFKCFIKPLIINGSIAFTIALYNQTDTFILGFIDESKKEVASYSVGIKSIDIIIGIITSLSTVFIPRATVCYNNEDKTYFKRLNAYSINICLFIVLPAIATMTTLAKPITGLISGNTSFEESIGYLSSPTILIILSTVMLTYSIGDIIYGQILLPSKKEKYYLFAILVGTALNIVLSIVFGKFVFPSNPAVGVAIGTSVIDLMIIIFLIVISWKWVKNAIFNINSVKILLASLVVLGLTLLIRDPIYNAIFNKTNNSITSSVLVLALTVLIDAVVYLSILILSKENLVSSFIKRKEHKDA